MGRFIGKRLPGFFKKPVGNVAGLLDYLIIGGRSTGLPAGALYWVGADTYPVTRGGLTFGDTWGTSLDNQGTGGPDSRFNSSLQCVQNHVFKVDLPNGTYEVTSASGINFATVNQHLRMRNGSNNSIFFDVSASVSGGSAMDATGAVINPANYDTVAGKQTIVVTGGGGITFENPNAPNYLNFIRFKQIA